MFEFALITKVSEFSFWILVAQMFEFKAKVTKSILNLQERVHLCEIQIATIFLFAILNSTLGEMKGNKCKISAIV